MDDVQPAWRQDRQWVGNWWSDRVSAGVEWDPAALGLSVGINHAPRRNASAPADLRAHVWIGPITLTAHVEVGRRHESRLRPGGPAWMSLPASARHALSVAAMPLRRALIASGWTPPTKES